MAKVTVQETNPQPVSSFYSWWQIASIGAALGLIYIGLTFLLSHFIIDPFNCRITVNSTACLNSWDIAGNVATILIGAIGTGVLVRLRTSRPLQIAVASAVLLWGLSSWTQGLSLVETIVWTVGLYALAYLLFSWIARWVRTMPTVASMLIILLVARIVLAS